MKFKLLLLFLFGITASWVHSQTTVTIGSGTSGSSGGTERVKPVYRSSATSSFDFSQSIMLYTESDLQAAGIFPGEFIYSIGFYKDDGNEIVPGGVANLNVDLYTTTATSLDVSDTYINLTSTATRTFSGTVDNTVFSTANLVTIDFQNGFSYNGGSLAIGMDWDISGITGNPTTGEFSWLYDTVPGIQSRGNDSSSSLATISLASTQTRRFQVDITFGPPPTCLRPMSFAVGTVTDTTADFTWTSGGSPNQSSYEIEITDRGVAPTGTPTVSGITTLNTTISSLTPATAYDAYIVADCGAADGKSIASGPVSFRTPGRGDDCATALPLTLNADCSDPAAVSEQLDLGARIDLGSFAGCDTLGTNTGAWYEFTSGTLENVTLTTSIDMKYEVFDACAGTSIVCESTVGGSAEIISSLTPSTNYKIAIWVDGLSMDVVDICLEEGPTCLPPSGITVGSITGTMAEISWVDAPGANIVDYDVVVVAQGDPVTGPVVASASNVTSPATVSGLSGLSNYDVFVMTNCTGTNESPFTVPVSFTTACAPLPTPYFQDFEGFTASSAGLRVQDEECWNDISVDGFDWNADNLTGTGSTATGPSGAFSGTTFIFTEASSPSVVGDIAVLETPEFDLTGLSSPAVSFYYHMYGSAVSSLDLYITNDGGATYVLFDQIVGQQQTDELDPWLLRALDLSAYANDIVRFKFENTIIDGPNVNFFYENDVALDDFSVLNIDCFPARDISLANISSDGVDVDWIAQGNNVVDFDVVVTNAGDPITAPVITFTNVTNPTIVSGLIGNTEYDIYVTTNCSSGTSSVAAGPVRFKTLCAAFPAPYTADFEDFATASSFGTQVIDDQCWNDTSAGIYNWRGDNSGGTGTANTGPDAAFSPTTFLYVESSSGAIGDVASLVSPDIDTSTLTAPALFFYYHMFGSAISSLDVYVSDDSGATYTLISSIVGQQQTASSDPWIEAVLDLSSYANQTIRVKFESTKVDSTPTPGDSDEGDVAIDDFRVLEAPPCLRPANLNASNAMFDSTAGTSSVDLDWTAGGPTQNLFDILIVTSGTPISGSTPPTNPGITGTITTIGNLTPGTRFDAYVRADCGAMDGVSFYAGPTAFRTPGPGDECAEPFNINVEPDCMAAAGFNLDLTNAIDLGTGFASCAGTGPNLGAWFEFNVGRGQSSITVNASEATSFAIFDACAGIELRCGTLSATQSADLGDLDARTDYKMVVWSTSTATPSVNVCVEEGPDCVAPYDLELISAITDTAVLSWTPGENFQNNFNILIFNSGDDPDIDMPVVDEMGVTSIPYMSPNTLVEGQFYDFYVTSDCSGGAGTDLSERSDPLTFRVSALGETITSAIPLTVNADCDDPSAVTFPFGPAAAFDLDTSNLGNCETSTSVYGAWFEFVAPSTGAVIITFQNLEYTIFDENGVEIVCSTLTTADTTGVVSNLIPGQTYKLVLRRFATASLPTNTQGDVCVEEGPDCSIAITPPYLEDFTFYVNTNPGDCWEEAEDGTIATGPASIGESLGWSEDEFLNDFTNGSESANGNLSGTGNVDWIISPRFDLTAGNYEVVVDAALTDEFNSNQLDFDTDDKVSLAYSDDNGLTYTEFYVWDINNQPSELGETYFIPIPSTAASVRIAVVTDTGSTTGGFATETDFFIDNFRIRTIPSCPDTRSLSVDAFGSTTATISFVSGSTSSSGNFEYAVTAPGAGTPTMVTGAWSDAGAVGQANPMITYTIMGLTSNTDYDVYVREVCAPGDVSAWTISPATFTTACDAFVAPYFTNFENFTPSDEFAVDQCWSLTAGTGYDWQIFGPNWGGFDSIDTGPDAPFSGTNYLYAEASSGATGDVTIVTGPLVDISGLTNPAIYFYYHMFGEDMGSYDVEVSLDNGVTFTNVFNLTGEQQTSETAPWIEAEIDLTAFVAANPNPMNNPLQFRLIGTRGTSFESDIMIDDFSVQNIISCRRPLNVIVVDVQTSSVDLTWEAGAMGQNDFTVNAYLAGQPPVGTPAATDVATALPTAAAPFRLNGLLGSTAYDVYVIANCGPGDDSLASDPATFLTDCEAVTSFPYATDFNTNLGPATCWEEGEGGDLTVGILAQGTSEWKADDHLDSGGNVVQSSSLNMFGNSTVNWLVSEQFDFNGLVSATLNVTTAVTAFDDPTAAESMGADDTMQLAYLDMNDANATWVELEVWSEDPLTTAVPSVNGTASNYDLSALLGGTYRFAFVGSTNASDPEDFDFHVSEFRIDATASTQSISNVSFNLYPNPLKEGTLNVVVAGDTSSKYNVAIYNTLGQQILSTSIEPVSNVIRVEDLDGLSSGMYFISIKGDMAESTLKFLKE